MLFKDIISKRFAVAHFNITKDIWGHLFDYFWLAVDWYFHQQLIKEIKINNGRIFNQLFNVFGVSQNYLASFFIVIADLLAHFFQKHENLGTHQPTEILCHKSKLLSLLQDKFVNFVCKNMHIDALSFRWEKLLMLKHHNPVLRAYR